MNEHIGMSPLTASNAEGERSLKRKLTVLFNGENVEVHATLESGDSIDQLIRVLQANKPLLPEKLVTPPDANEQEKAD